jgi:hypothetical protein
LVRWWCRCVAMGALFSWRKLKVEVDDDESPAGFSLLSCYSGKSQIPRPPSSLVRLPSCPINVHIRRMGRACSLSLYSIPREFTLASRNPQRDTV